MSAASDRLRKLLTLALENDKEGEIIRALRLARRQAEREGRDEIATLIGAALRIQNPRPLIAEALDMLDPPADADAEDLYDFLTRQPGHRAREEARPPRLKWTAAAWRKASDRLWENSTNGMKVRPLGTGFQFFRGETFSMVFAELEEAQEKGDDWYRCLTRGPDFDLWTAKG